MKSTCLQRFGVQSYRLSFWQPSSQSFLAMPASWGVADFNHELDSVHMLLQARPNLQPLKLQLKNQLLHKLDCINNLQAHDFLELYKVLEASSLPKDVLKDLTELVDARALGAQSTGNTKVVSVAQACDSLPLYLTDEDIKALAAVDMRKGIPILVSRLPLVLDPAKNPPRRLLLRCWCTLTNKEVDDLQVVTQPMCYSRILWQPWRRKTLWCQLVLPPWQCALLTQ